MSFLDIRVVKWIDFIIIGNKSYSPTPWEGRAEIKRKSGGKKI